jgi:mono/diheme cytochrome c family protein
VGRFGWKAQVTSVEELVRDALSVELGLTLPARAGLSFGQLEDNDGVADPELGAELELQLQRYLLRLGPPPRQRSDDPAAVSRGAATFEALGCAACHSPALQGASGPVPLYSDLLLHDILPEGTVGIEEGSAGGRELRTPPLWGLAHSAPYLHDGAASTLTAAIAGHHGEGAGARAAFEAIIAGAALQSISPGAAIKRIRFRYLAASIKFCDHFALNSIDCSCHIVLSFFDIKINILIRIYSQIIFAASVQRVLTRRASTYIKRDIHIIRNVSIVLPWDCAMGETVARVPLS